MHQGISERKASKNSDVMLGSIILWSRNDMYLKEDREMPTGRDGVREEERKVEDHRIFSVTCATADSVGETCLRLNVCPICMYFRLRGEDIKAVKEQACGDHKILPFTNNNGWANALAKAHNKEQHALNGNITDRTITASRPTREMLMLHDGGMGYDSNRVHREGKSRSD